MQTTGPAKKVTILLRRPAERHGYLKILELLKAEGATNAVAFRTVAAVDAIGHIEINRLVEIPVELPTVILWSDSPDRVERILPRIGALIEDGVVMVDDTTIALAVTPVVADLPSTVTVAEFMTREVVTVRPETPMREVVVDLVTKRFRSVPVVDDDRRVVGIITNGDLVRRGGLPLRLELLKTFDTPELHQHLEAMAAPHVQAQEVMTRDVATVPVDMDVRHAADLMLQRRLKRLPVVDAQGRLVGILSRVDLLRSVMQSAERPATEHAAPLVFSGETPVGEVMSRSVPAVSSNAPMRDVLNVVAATRLNRAVVVDEDRRVLGVISDADIVERLDPDVRPGIRAALMQHVPFIHGGHAGEQTYRHANARTARDLMHTDIVVASESEPVSAVLGEMLEKGKKVVPIVDDNGRLVGIVDRADFLRGIAQQ